MSDKPRCPICGDPQIYILWIDPEPPDGCPVGADIVTNCSIQMERARGEAERRRAAPDCFDENGLILPGKLGEVLMRVAAKAKVKGVGDE